MSANGTVDLSEALALVGCGAPPTGVAAKRVRLFDATGAELPWPSALGQTTINEALPVVIAIDQSPIPATQYFWNGTGYERARTANTFVTITATAITGGTGITLVTVDQNKRFRLLGYRLSSSANASFKFFAGASGAVNLTTLMFQGPLLPVTNVDDTPYLGNGVPWAAGQYVNLDVSATSTVSGTIWGTLEISPSGGPA